MDEETRESLRGIAARLYAIQVGVMAIMETHPDPAALRRAVSVVQEAPLAIFLNLAWPEQDVQKYSQTIEQLLARTPHQ